MRHLHTVVLSSSLILAATGCGDRSLGGGSETDATEGDPGTTGSSTTDPDDTDPGSGDVPHDLPDDPVIECAGTVVDHSADCNEGCAIVEDVRITCNATEFGDPGLRVAPSPDATLLVTAASTSAWLMELDAQGLILARELPDALDRAVISLALDPEGMPHLAADSTKPPDYAGGLVFVSPSADAYDIKTIFDRPDKYIPLFDMEYDADGRAHVWFSADPPDDRTESIRAIDGTWTERDAPVPGTSGWQRYTVTAGGASVGFDFVEQSGQWFLVALSEGATQRIGNAFGPSYPGGHVHVAPPALPSAGALEPAYVLVKQHDDGARVAWPTAEGSEEVPIPSTGPVQYTCVVETDGQPGQCPASCEESGVGVEERMVGTARTPDGRVWVAWMVTYLDRTLTYEESCNDEVGCWCNAFIERDDSHGELVLAEIDVESLGVREVFRVADTDPRLEGLFLDYRESPRPLDIRAFGTDLAVGARVRDTDAASPPAIRVLRVDTTLVP